MKKSIIRIISRLLAVILFFGAISFGPAAESAFAAYNAQQEWQSILDADLQTGSEDQYNTNSYNSNPESERGRNATETNRDVRDSHDREMTEEAETQMYDRFIVKYKDGSRAPESRDNIAQGSPRRNRIRSFQRIAHESRRQFAIVSVDEPVDIAEFTQELEAAGLDSNIEFIQPDYTMAISANTDITAYKDWDVYLALSESRFNGNQVAADAQDSNENATETDANANENDGSAPEHDTDEQAPGESAPVEAIVEVEPSEAPDEVPADKSPEVYAPEESEPEENPPVEYESEIEIPVAETTKGTPEEAPEAKPEEETPNVTNSGAVIVALLDTGVDLNHPDLAGRLYINPYEIPGNMVDDDGNGYIDDISGWDFFNNDNSADDAATCMDQWHGTHIAGIISSQAPDATILPIKIFEGGYAYTSDIINAIAYAESMGASVINCSWGSLYENRALREAIEGSGCLFVCSVGNNLYNIDNYPVYPAAYSNELNNVISVASVDNSLKLSRFSNYGAGTVDIAAYGENIESSWLSGGRQSISGTSMSAASVSAAAALLYARDNAYTPFEVRRILTDSADTVTGLMDKVKGGKLLNADQAIYQPEHPNTNVIYVPDDDPLPVVIPNQAPEEDSYELSGAESYVTFKTSMNTERHGLQAVALNGKIYAIGGQTAGVVAASYTNTVEKYDPLANTWTTATGMNTARSYFGAVAYGGMIYVMGGQSTNGAYLNSIERYDPASDTWTTLGVTLPVAMSSFTATLIPGTSSVYIIGGSAGYPLNSVYEYNITANAVTAKPSLSVLIAKHVAYNGGDYIYIDGGVTTAGASSVYGYSYSIPTGVTTNLGLSSFYLCDAAAVRAKDRVVIAGGVTANTPLNYTAEITNKYADNYNYYLVTSNNLNIARAGAGAVYMDGKVYFIGGINSSGVMPLVEMMDLGWEEKAEPPVTLRDYETVSINGKIYLMGGSRLVGGADQMSNAVYEYDASTDSWKTMNSPMPVYAKNFSLVAAYGKIYMIGGQTAQSINGLLEASNTIYEYYPQTDTWAERNTISSERYSLSSVLFNGKIYITGGLNSNGVTTATVEVFDPLLNTVELSDNMTGGRSGHYSCVLGGELYIFTFLSTTYLKRDASGVWSQIALKNSYYTDLYIMLNDSLYTLSYANNASATPYYYKFSQGNNSWEYFQAFNYFGSINKVVQLNNKAFMFTSDASGYCTGLVTYTPPASAWTQKASIPENRYDFGVAVIDNDIYAAGGYATVVNNGVVKAEILGNLERYDEALNMWTTLASMSRSRYELGLETANGKLYAIGGRDTMATYAIVEEYDPATNIWTTKATMPEAIADMATASYNGLIYIFGGQNAYNGISNAVRIYDPSTNSWSVGTGMPTARHGAGAAVIDGKIYVVGGFTSASMVATAVLEIYDPATGMWDTSKKPLPRALGKAGVVASDSLYVIDGFNGTDEISLVHEYNPALDEWLIWDGPNTLRYGFGAAITERGIYAIAGRSIGGIFATVEFATLERISTNDYRHYGDDTINLSGNFSRTYVEMSYASQGFNVEFSRTYNSQDKRDSLISPGWSFGFSGKIESSGNDVVAFLPNGSGVTFKKNVDGSFKSLDSRSTLVKNADGTYTLTTNDQYSYGFDANRYLCWMKDRNGNQITITVDSTGKVSAVTDQTGRVTTIAYVNDKISVITDPAGRTSAYSYDAQDRLSSVKDPNGNYIYYTYNADGLLETIKDNNNTVLESITYYPALENGEPRVSSVIDNLGNKTTYVYDDNDGKLTATDSTGRVNATWYDKTLYPVRALDAEGRETRAQYNLDSGINRYGEVESATDRNGNTTHFERDGNGNITRQINPDGSTREYTYDAKNNVLSERDELGKYVFYVYDTYGANLVKTAQPLNGTDIYSAGAVQADFAITGYEYYTGAEALTQTGKTVYGLLKNFTDPEGGVTTYTYDAYGNIATTTSPGQRSTAYQYNKLGWLKTITSPMGYVTSYYYDRNGNLLKTVNPDGGVLRSVYDYRNNVTQRIMPTQYLASADTAAAFDAENIQSSAGAAYAQTDHGYRYAYNSNGTLASVTDPLNFATSYTYDLYGNKLTETKPNGAVYGYTYTLIDLPETATFKETSSSAAVTLASYSYAILSNGNTTITTTQYFDSANSAATKTTFDYAGRPIRVDYADGTYVTSVYNANGTLARSTDANGNTTYYAYDGLNRQIRQWSPVGANTYEYSTLTYDKASRISTAAQSTEPVANGAVPTAGLITKSYIYDADGLVTQETTSGGGKTTYAYDNNGNVTDKYSYYDSSDYNHEYFTYDNMDRLATLNIITQERDIDGYSDSDASLTLTSSFMHDKNGNTLSETDPNSITTTYAFDLMDRPLTTSRPGLDEDSVAVTITTSQTYDWAGGILTSTNELGRVTSYTYDQRGYLTTITDPKGGVQYFAYDRAGRKTAEVSPNNYDNSLTLADMSRTEYTYDVMSRVLRETQVYKDNTGAWKAVVSKAYEYDNNGNVIKSQDALGYQGNYGTLFEYDMQNRITKTIDPECQLVALPYSSLTSYDGLGRITRGADANGVETSFTYDEHGNILTVEVGGVLTQTNTYDLLGNLLTSKDGNGNVSTYTYNSLNKLRSSLLPGDSTIGAYTVTYKYTKLGLPATQTDDLGKQVALTYDNQGRLLSSTEKTSNGAQAITVTSRYDVAGNLRYQTDGNGNTTQYTYDELNRKITAEITVTDINNISTVCTTTYAYDANGNLTSETDWRGNTYSYAYDALNRITQKADPSNTIIENLEYNDNDAQIYSTDALGNTTEFQYDRNGRLTKTIDGAGNTQSQYYDAVGNVIRSVDGNNHSTYFAYDDFNHLSQVTNALNEITEYTYDINGNMLTQTDAAGNVSTVRYNVRNLPVTRIEPGGISGSVIDASKAMSYTYNADGSVATETDQNGVTTAFIYDIHGRLLSKSAGDKTVSYTYDNNGNILGQTDENGTTTRAYDSLNRTISKDVPGIGLTTYLYDITANMPTGYLGQTTTVPLGNVATKIYDQMGRLYQVTSGNDTTTYSYYANGNKQSMTYPNSVTAQYTYYSDNRLHTLANMINGAYLSTFNYAYDGAGNMVTKLELKGTTEYVYDAIGRLTKVTEPDGRVTEYDFDAAGNRITETVTVDNSVTTTSYTYNEQNRLLSTVETSDDAEKTTDFHYDKNGNQISRLVSTIAGPGASSLKLNQPGTSDADEITYEISRYDVFGHLTSVQNDTYTAEYAYNADGLRISKSVTTNRVTTTTMFLYESGSITLELDDAGEQTAYNVYGGDSIISRYTEQSDRYYLYNGRGDVVQLTNDNGNVTQTYDYDAFGNLLEGYLDDTNPFRFCGEYWDDETKNYYLRARYYNPATGRFTQRDAFLGFSNDPLSLNRYTYCSNNPIRYCDPWGYWQIGDEDLNMDAQAKILVLTLAYHAAATKEERDLIHAEADVVRKDPSSSGSYTNTLGITVQRDTLVDFDQEALNNYMNELIATNGVITKEDTEKALQLVNATTKTNTTVIPISSPTVISVSSTTTTTTFGRVDYQVISSYNISASTGQINASPISLTVSAHYLAYFLYNPRWYDDGQVEQNLEYIADYYGIEISDIGTAAIGTDATPRGANGHEFADSWNSISTPYDGGRVKVVVVFNHGNPRGLEAINNAGIQNLESKSIDNLLLFSCNAGHTDYIGDNPASYFAEKIDGGKVMASDGTLVSDLNMKYTSGPYSGEQYWDSIADNGFYYWVYSSPRYSNSPGGAAYRNRRDNQGFIIYQIVNGVLQNTPTGQKQMSIKEALDLMK